MTGPGSACDDQRVPPARPGDPPVRPGDPPVRPPLERRTGEALVAGVAAGLARHLGVEPLVVRIGFVVLTVAGGSGLLLYGAFWAFVPQDAGSDAAAERPLAERFQLPALAALALGGLLLASQLGLFVGQTILWPALVVGAGVALVWRQADDAQRARWMGDAVSGGGIRVLAGVVLLVVGVTAFLAANADLGAVGNGMVAMVAVVAGLGVTFAPWWWRILADLRAERRERIRSQERAEVAAHLHDGVLQTLALIQRHAESPGDVQRLARSQERELRSWLFAAEELADDTLAAAVRAVAAEVEKTYDVAVEVVAVGDADLDDRLRALTRATREAIVNAAKFAGVATIDVFVEVRPEEVEVFVRDTGSGFAPSAVPPDRRGIAESIVGRMARHGGTARVRSEPGEGTEVELRMKRGVA
jgi:signal transduction histidine kinase/phage shock protein PspC (stress-responsive transcriptional regulator)